MPVVNQSNAYMSLVEEESSDEDAQSEGAQVGRDKENPSS